jgi:[acyl-carrier-protein] S-malonyltransferase
MANAVPELRKFMADIPFARPRTTILFNATAEEEEDPERIKDTMAQQLVSAVRWYEIILKMLDDGIDLFLEIGPKKVLSGLLKKIVPPEREVQVWNVEDCKSLPHVVEALV